MNSDSVENIGIGRRENLRHRAARRQACGENPFLLDAEFPRQGLRQACELGRLSRSSLLMAPVKPIPATGRIRAPRLVWIGDDETELVRQVVHLRSQGEIFRILRASMQHEQQCEVPLLVVGRDVEPVIQRAGWAAISARGKSFAKVMAGPRVGRIGRVDRVRQHGAAGAQGAQNLAQWTPRRGRKGGTRRRLRPSFRFAPAAPRLLAGQRLAQESGRLNKV